MIKVYVENSGEYGNAELFERCARQAFCMLGLQGEAFAELEFVNAQFMQDINREQRGVDRVTDVLSFPLLNEIMPFTADNYPYDYDAQADGVNLGSVLICGSEAENQAKEFGHTLQRECAFLFIHGLLHLLGYDHIDSDDREKMRGAEESVLESMNITR